MSVPGIATKNPEIYINNDVALKDQNQRKEKKIHFRKSLLQIKKVEIYTPEDEKRAMRESLFA
jgi:hypothetical protein